jgi:hypothetical protein
MLSKINPNAKTLLLTFIKKKEKLNLNEDNKECHFRGKNDGHDDASFSASSFLSIIKDLKETTSSRSQNERFFLFFIIKCRLFSPKNFQPQSSC